MKKTSLLSLIFNEKSSENFEKLFENVDFEIKEGVNKSKVYLDLSNCQSYFQKNIGIVTYLRNAGFSIQKDKVGCYFEIQTRNEEDKLESSDFPTMNYSPFNTESMERISKMTHQEAEERYGKLLKKSSN